MLAKVFAGWRIVMRVVLPIARAATSSVVGRGRLLVPDQRRASAPARPPTILRL
ncbi:MAG TPA: hypothetical protein VI485_17785 [Vicinamibacterales bacterium]|nr:hypothetical protein [Vicinamibacterales bacterium]